MGNLLAIIKSIFWLIVRGLTRRDKAEPQREINKARRASRKGDDKTLNDVLSRARDRMRGKPHRD